MSYFVNFFLNLTYCLPVLACKCAQIRASELEMTLFVSKLQRRDAADRDALGRAIPNACRADKAIEGVRSTRFYWVNPDEVALPWSLRRFVPALLTRANGSGF